MKRTSLPVLALALGLGGTPAMAQLHMADDYYHMMGWLSNEVVQGLSFSAGETFDPPHELAPGKIRPDISLGLGSVPLNKSRFPQMNVPALAEKNPAMVLPNDVRFPNLTVHLRVGLPGRMDLSLRGADMTVPHGHQLAPGTTGDGQSNTIGVGIRKHFLGNDGEEPLLSIGMAFNHVKGHFNFVNQLSQVALVPGYTVDAANRGRLEWNVNSLGANAVVSQTFGMWTPFLGAGLNYMTGSVKARLQSDFATDLILPVVGEASARPETIQTRLITGMQMDSSHFGLFVDAEVKASGQSAGQTYMISMGITAPFRFGSTSMSSRAPEEDSGGRRMAYDSRLEPHEGGSAEMLFLR